MGEEARKDELPGSGKPKPVPRKNYGLAGGTLTPKDLEPRAITKHYRIENEWGEHEEVIVDEFELIVLLDALTWHAWFGA